MSTVDALRKQTRKVETDLDLKLVQYSRLDGGDEGSSSSAPKRPEKSSAVLQREIEQLLRQLGEVNDSMSRHTSTATGGAASTMHVLQRHREILHDFTQEFHKTRQNLQRSDERQQLLSSVRQDIREHRSNEQRATDALLRERNAIAGSARLADDAIGQATAMRESLLNQRGVFDGMGGKLMQLSAVAPQMNALIGKIGIRKKRDKLILGAVIGVCTTLLLLYAFG